jgi:hypothetical protein
VAQSRAKTDSLIQPASPNLSPARTPPLGYGLGALGLVAIGEAFGGYYQFYYVDVLGLAVALTAIINTVGAVLGDATELRRVRPGVRVLLQKD